MPREAKSSRPMLSQKRAGGYQRQDWQRHMLPACLLAGRAWCGAGTVGARRNEWEVGLRVALALLLVLPTAVRLVTRDALYCRHWFAARLHILQIEADGVFNIL